MNKLSRCVLVVGAAGLVAAEPPASLPQARAADDATTQSAAAPSPAPPTQNAFVQIESPTPATLPTTALPSTGPSTGPATRPGQQTPVVIIGATTTAVPNHNPAQKIRMNFKDASIDAVLEHLADVAGFVILKEEKVTGRITIISPQPISADEAVSLLNSVLKVQGYAAIQMGRILKVTTRDKARVNTPVHYGADPKQIAETDELITQVIPVRSVDAIKLKQDLQPLVATDASLSANAGSNTIILTDTSANIRRVVEIVSNLDKKDATENQIRVKQLKYADATAAAKLINDIFNPQGSSNNQSQFQGAGAFFRRGGGGGGGPGGGGGGFPGFGGGGFPGAGGGGGQPQQQDRGETGHVLASADTRTNTIVVSGPVDTLKVVDDVITQLDANPAAEQTFFMYRVKNGQAIDMQNTLNSLFSGTAPSNTQSNLGNRTSYNSSTGNRASSGFGSNSGFGGSSSRTGSQGSNNNNSGAGGNRNANTAGNTGNRGQVAGGQAGGRAGAGGAVSDLIGQVTVVADQDTNSLLIATATKYEERVKQIVLELDRPVPQVLIKCLIAEVTHDNSDDLGLDFSILNLRANGKGAYGASVLGNAAASIANGGLTVGLLETNLNATFHALAVAGKLDVLSRPYILASDNQQADITVGQEVPFITDSRVTDTGQTINTIQYQDIGIILDVTPHINPDGLVILDVSPQISSQSEQSVQIQPGVNAPVFNKRSADSRVAIKDGETIVIGGLMQDQKNETITKIPLLGDIPGLGQLFRRTNVQKTKTELLIFLTPHVALAPSRLHSMSQDEMRGLKLTPGAVQPGTFQDHMEGMQRGGHAGDEPLIPDTQPAFRTVNPPLEPPLPGTDPKRPDGGQ